MIRIKPANTNRLAFTIGAILSFACAQIPALAAQHSEAKKTSAGQEAEYKKLDRRRIATIEAWLPAAPAGLGPSYQNREIFDRLAATKDGISAIAAAEKILATPFPAWSDEDYLEFSRVGTRPRGEAMINARRTRLSPLVWAEVLENRGRFLGAIEESLREYIGEPTWSLPAHDRELNNFRRKRYTVDLLTSTFGAELAQSIYLLGDRLDPALRDQVRAALRERLWAPMLDSLRGGPTKHWWLETTNNWNAVCLAGVTGSALATLPDRHERAVLAAAAEVYGSNSVAGFTDDGYCSEGIGYWNYGFGNFMMLRAVLFSATDGRLDLFTNAKIRQIALFGPRLEILPGVFPAIADCRFETKPSTRLIAQCDQILGLGLGLNAPVTAPTGAPRRVTDTALNQFGVFPLRQTGSPAPSIPPPRLELRSFFPDAGVLVCRPAQGGALGAALKGGHNDEHHNHNDVGSFTIALGEGQPVGDPGGPHAYTSETFGPLRYTKFEMFRSRNHPVPLLAGREQSPGRQAAARILRTEFQPDRDIYALDLKSAYEVPGLKRMERTFAFTRVGAGSLEVRDDFAFDRPESFETSLTTHGTWKRTSERTLEFTHRGSTALLHVESPVDFDITEQRIEENAPAFTRVGIRLRQPIQEGAVILRFTPVPSSVAP